MILALPDCGLGDALALTATVRELHLQTPGRVVAVLDSPYREVFEGNPHFGPEDVARLDGVSVDLEVEIHGDVGNIAVAFGIQLGVRVTDSTPEIYGVDGARPVGGPRVAVDPHSRAASRRWSYHRWCEVVETLTGYGIAVYGVGKHVPGHDPGDSPDIRGLAGLASDYTDLLSLRQTAATIKGMDLFVGMDSGGAHLAAAVGVPQVVLYSRSPWYARSYWNTTPVFHQAAPCPALCNRDCVTGSLPGCLDHISARDVVDAVMLALRRFPRKDPHGPNA